MAKTIKDKGPTKRLVDPKTIARALCAEEEQVALVTKSGPISLFSLRQFIVDRLHSTK